MMPVSMAGGSGRGTKFRIPLQNNNKEKRYLISFLQFYCAAARKSHRADLSDERFHFRAADRSHPHTDRAINRIPACDGVTF
jgi:hypothetical protein